MILWLTDIHLDHTRDIVRRYFYQYVAKFDCPVVISGDIGSADSALFYLTEMKKYITKDIYFISGNHDYYNGSVDKCKEEFSNFPLANYLFNKPYWLINSDTAIVGGVTLCDPNNIKDTGVRNYDINDFVYIKDFDTKDWHDNLTRIFNEEMDNFKKSLESVPEDIKHIIVVTHPVLYKQMDTYGDKKLSKYFVNESAGRLLNNFVEDNQDRKFIVLSGHTHMKSSYRFDDLRAYSSNAEYKNPSVAGLINEDFRLVWKDLNIVMK